MVLPYGNMDYGETIDLNKLEVEGTLSVTSDATFSSNVFLGDTNMLSYYLTSSNTSPTSTDYPNMLSVDGYIKTRALVNSGQNGTSPGAIIFGDGATNESNKISLVTNGIKRVYITDGSTAVSNDLEINTDKFTVASATGNTVVEGTLDVTGAIGATTINASGAVGVNGNFDVNTDKFTVASATGNTVVAGTLDVTGDTTLSGKLSMADDEKIVFGASQDLEIFHDTANSVIRENGTGVLQFQVSNTTQMDITNVGEATRIYGQLKLMTTGAGAPSAITALPETGGGTPVIFYSASAGRWKAQRGDGLISNIRGDGSISLSPSDDNLKFNEISMKLNGITTVKKLACKRYYQKQSLIDPDDISTSTEQIGFIAQEVEAIKGLECLVGELDDVRDDTQKVKALNYEGITVVNTKALQELIYQFELLESRVALLEN
tara:strand:+ start:479 stop:1780 length:1302 start_codon:yes stop_codon:yes gene_type:complete